MDYGKIIVCGSRRWGQLGVSLERQSYIIRHALAAYYDVEAGPPPGSSLVHGACSRIVYGLGEVSADMIAAGIAAEREMLVKSYPADWERCGNRAGPLRNERMILENRDAAWLLAFTDDPPGKPGSGTWDCVRRAHAVGIPVAIYSSQWRGC